MQKMKWNHLPVAGGIYDQHPKFMDHMQILMEEEAKAEKRRAQRREAEAKSSKKGKGRR